MVQLAHMLENHGDMHKNLIIRSDKLLKGRSESKSLKIEAGALALHFESHNLYT